MIKKLEKIVEKIENFPISFSFWMLSFAGIISVRIALENFPMGMRLSEKIMTFYDFFDSYLIISLLFFWIINGLLGVSFKKAFNVIIYGYLLTITPPIFDYIISGGKGFQSLYVFDSLPGLAERFLKFFGDHPDIGITYGIRVEIALAMIFFFVYGYIKSKNILKSCLISLLIYSILFFFGTFPSWVEIAIHGPFKGFLSVTSIDAVQRFFSPFSLFNREISDIASAMFIKINLFYVLILPIIILIWLLLYKKEKLLSFLKNVRLPQIFYHSGLLILGMGTGMAVTGKPWSFDLFDILGFLVLLESVILSWLASVIVNDIFDEKIDKLTNPNRPLINGSFSLEEYKLLGQIFFIAAIFFSYLADPKITILLLIYQAIAWIYSAWPLRLKRFAFLSTLISASASLVIFIAGFILISPTKGISELPLSIIALILISLTLSLPIKDFRDIDGDKKDGVYTIPVVFGEYWGKIIVGSGIFLSFLLSVIVLNEFRLFWWALILGGISFWIVNKMKKNPADSRINYRNIFWWILGIVFTYGLALIKVIFL